MTTISRRVLYAHGETLGEVVTRREAGRIVCGGGDSNSSQATNQTDKRLAVGNGGIGVSADNSSVGVTVNVTDGGMVSRALDSVDKSNAMLGGGYDKLLSAADKLFQRGESLIGQTQQAVADAYGQAQNDAKSTIDNRTVTVIALAGAAVAAVAFWSNKK